MLLGTALVVLTALIFFSCRVGGTSATRPDSIPHRGISASTIGLVRVDLAELRPNNLRDLLVEGGVNRAEADIFLSGIEQLRSTLSSAGISSAALPISYDLSAFDNVGVYLGGDERQNVEELESTLLRSGGGTLLGWTTLMSSVTDVGYGWRFWGVTGDGMARSVDETRAKRLEDALRNLPPSAVRLILLGEFAGEIEPIDAGSPRLLRQLKHLRKASRGLIALDLSLPRSTDADPMKPVASAVFQSEGDARAFHQAWAQLSMDLLAAAGPTPADGPGGPLVFAMLQRLATATPSLSGTIVRWTPK